MQISLVSTSPLKQVICGITVFVAVLSDQIQVSATTNQLDSSSVSKIIPACLL